MPREKGRGRTINESGKLRCFSLILDRLFLLEQRFLIEGCRGNWVCLRVELEFGRRFGLSRTTENERSNYVSNDVEETWKRVLPSDGCVFTASRGTFAFAAESLGLFHSPPSFFTSLSSVLKSQRLREIGEPAWREEHGT